MGKNAKQKIISVRLSLAEYGQFYVDCGKNDMGVSELARKRLLGNDNPISEDENAKQKAKLDDLEKSKKSLQRTNKNLSNKLDDLQKKYAALNEQHTTLLDDFDKLDKQYKDLVTTHQKLDAKHNELIDECNQMDFTIKDLRKELYG